MEVLTRVHVCCVCVVSCVVCCSVDAGRERAKLEVVGEEKGNPIMQDVKNGKPRFFCNPVPFNYGCLPQTWEDPSQIVKDTGRVGDNDPLDAIEISGQPLGVGG